MEEIVEMFSIEYVHLVCIVQFIKAVFNLIIVILCPASVKLVIVEFCISIFILYRKTLFGLIKTVFIQLFF